MRIITPISYMTHVGKVLIHAAHPIKLAMTTEFDFLGLQIGDLEF